jgi:hypothetical protein
MTTGIKMSIDNGNAKTIFSVEANTTSNFWNNYLTQSYLSKNDNFYFPNSFDLMGNIIPKASTKKTIRKLFSKA